MGVIVSMFATSAVSVWLATCVMSRSDKIHALETELALERSLRGWAESQLRVSEMKRKALEDRLSGGPYRAVG